MNAEEEEIQNLINKMKENREQRPKQVIIAEEEKKKISLRKYEASEEYKEH